MIRRYLFIISLMLLYTNNTNAQDAIFTQYYASPLQMNPAFAGNTIAPRIAMNYRDQWHNVPNAYSTFSASYDQFIEAFNSGFGFTLLSDQAGDGIYKRNNANVTYSYRLKVNKDFFIKMGVDAGVGQSNVDWNRLVFLDMIDPINGSVSNTASQEVPPQEFFKSYVDFGAGFVAYSNKFYVGLGCNE